MLYISILRYTPTIGENDIFLLGLLEPAQLCGNFLRVRILSFIELAVYGQSLVCLQKANYWSLTSIVEDGMQYWRSYFGWDGFFRIIHTPAICEMDLVDEKNIYRTIRSQYKHLRRWSWGCSDIEYILPEFIKNKKIATGEKIRKTIYLVYNHLFWAG